MRPIWLAAAALLLVYLVWRRRRLEPPLLVGGTLAALAMAVHGLGLVHLPNLDRLLKDAGSTLGAWTYLLVGLACFLESGAFVGLLIPGETVIVVGGMVAAQGKVDVILLIAIVWAASVAGDLLSFELGRRLGRDFLVRHGGGVGMTEERIRQVERFYDRHGPAAVFLGRWVGLVRAVSPFVAGSSEMALRRFLPSDVLAAGLQGTVHVMIGFVFWRSLDQVLAIAKRGAVALGATIALVVGLVAAVRWLRVRENRRRLGAWLAAHERTPVLGRAIRGGRAVARRLERPARFVRDRLTPGELGLELTTLLAVAAVGSFVFVGYLIVLSPVTTLTPGDHRAVRWAHALEAPWLTQLAKALTLLGTLPVAGGALAVSAAVLLARRHRLEGLALLAGLVLTYVAVHVTKGAVDRPRPPDRLVAASGSAYPSGHAAYSISWVAIAVALRHAVERLSARAGLLAAGVTIALLVGLTRIYLRAHWFSDVAGGWALGATCFALVGIAALVIGYVRGDGLSAR